MYITSSRENYEKINNYHLTQHARIVCDQSEAESRGLGEIDQSEGDLRIALLYVRFFARESSRNGIHVLTRHLERECHSQHRVDEFQKHLIYLDALII